MTTSIISDEAVRESWYSSLFFSVVPHALDAVAHSIMGVFKRAIFLPATLDAICCPPLSSFSKPINRLSDHSTQGDGYMVFAGILIRKEAVRMVIERARQIAVNLGLKKPIHFIPHYSGVSSITLNSSGEILFYLRQDIFLQTKDEIDFILARELAHVALNHYSMRAGVSLALFCLDLVAALCVSPWMVPLIEGVSAPIENAMHRKQKLAAELTAMKVLNTSQELFPILLKRKTHFFLWYYIICCQGG